MPLYLDVMSVDIGDIVTASRAFHNRLASEVEEGLVLPSKRRPQDVNLGGLDVTWTPVLHLTMMRFPWGLIFFGLADCKASCFSH